MNLGWHSRGNAQLKARISNRRDPQPCVLAPSFHLPPPQPRSLPGGASSQSSGRRSGGDPETPPSTDGAAPFAAPTSVSPDIDTWIGPTVGSGTSTGSSKSPAQSSRRAFPGRWPVSHFFCAYDLQYPVLHQRLHQRSLQFALLTLQFVHPLGLVHFHQSELVSPPMIQGIGAVFPWHSYPRFTSRSRRIVSSVVGHCHDWIALFLTNQDFQSAGLNWAGSGKGEGIPVHRIVALPEEPSACISPPPLCRRLGDVEDLGRFS